MPDSLDSLIKVPPPQYIGPRRAVPDLLVDEHRNLLMDPTDMTYVGLDGLWGGAGYDGRLAYAERTPASRSGV